MGPETIDARGTIAIADKAGAFCLTPAVSSCRAAPRTTAPAAAAPSRSSSRLRSLASISYVSYDDDDDDDSSEDENGTNSGDKSEDGAMSVTDDEACTDGESSEEARPARGERTKARDGKAVAKPPKTARASSGSSLGMTAASEAQPAMTTATGKPLLTTQIYRQEVAAAKQMSKSYIPAAKANVTT